MVSSEFLREHDKEIFFEILRASIYSIVRKTPVEKAKQLSHHLNNNVFYKREDLQPIFSFKIRGAYNKILTLKKQKDISGVICVSAGNHGQGVALAAQHLGMRAKVVMPVTTPNIKVEAVRSYGAEVVLFGDSYSDAAEYCQTILEEDNLAFIHPFDDETVIAGQGTIGKEVFESLPQLQYIFVPVGGGGLIAGIALYIKQIAPHVKIVGVEPKDSCAMYNSICQNDRVTLKETGTFADGVAVKKVGEKTFSIAKSYVDDWVVVSNDEICSAIEWAHRDTRTILEPAGALGVAGLKKYVQHHNLTGKTLVAINSGANINFPRMQFVAERVMLGNHQEGLYAVRLKEVSGELETFCRRVVGNRNITEFNYRRNDDDWAYIFVGIGIRDFEEKKEFEDDLRRFNYECLDLTENELAKEHIRYMVGGICHLAKESIYHFEFPERPEALANFLSILGHRWSISLFHYRSHGADYGRVLIGLLVPDIEYQEFLDFLDQVKYPYTNHSQNPVVRAFINPLIGQVSLG